MLLLTGTIVDLSVLIDLEHLQQWDWFASRHGPLYVAQLLLDSDHLDDRCRAAAGRSLTPVLLEGPAQFVRLVEFASRFPALGLADRATLILAETHDLTCATDDRPLVRACDELGVRRLRTLALLAEMVASGHCTREEAIQYADSLVTQRGKWLAPRVLSEWMQTLRAP